MERVICLPLSCTESTSHVEARQQHVWPNYFYRVSLTCYINKKQVNATFPVIWVSAVGTRGKVRKMPKIVGFIPIDVWCSVQFKKIKKKILNPSVLCPNKYIVLVLSGGPPVRVITVGSLLYLSSESPISIVVRLSDHPRVLPKC